MSDLRYELRALAASPGLALAAIVSLGIGIGANTALFSVAHAVLIRPLPYSNAERLVILWNRSPGLNIAEDWFSTAQYFDIKQGHQGFDALAIAIGSNLNLTGSGEPERIGVIRVSSNLLPMLGATALRGRLLVPGEDVPGKPAIAVLAYGTWMRRFGGDPAAVGQSVTLNGLSYEIVGILPESFSLPREVLPTLGVAEDGEIFLPLPLAPSAAGVRTREDYNIIGKLKPGVSVSSAQAEMDTITARLRHDFPDVYPPNGGLTFSIVPLFEQVVGGVRRPLWILVGSVGFVLLIACANVANLLLARALSRRREIAMRIALGATRGRIVRQLLTESVLLAVAGGALGVLFALAAVQWVHLLQPVGLPRLRAIAVDAPVLLFTLGVSLVSGVLFGLAPALGTGRIDVQTTLKEGARGFAGSALWSPRLSMRRLLVVTELALAVILLAGAGLLIRSLVRLQSVPPGFDPSGVLTLELTMAGRTYADGAAVQNAYHRLWERLDGLPGVAASGGVTSLPLSQYFSWGPITVEGRTPLAGENFLNADQRVVGGRYFQAMRIPLVAGRFFDDRDSATNPRVIIVDEFMARELWPGQDAIGKRLHAGDAKSTSPWMTVVGVVGRVKQYGLDTDGRIALYLPQTQAASRAMYVVVRADEASSRRSAEGAKADGLVTPVRTAIRGLDPDLPLYHVRSMADRVRESLARQRFSMLLLTIFAGVAVALAAIGIYGVMAYVVSQGTREIGIRVALGATPLGMLGLVLRHGLAMAGVGLGAGLAGAAALAQLMQSLLFGISGTDAVTFSTVAVILGGIALAASYFPARRAARIDPVVSLRSE